MRETSLKTVFELARKDERVFFIGSDLGYGVLKEFKKEIPSRFFMEGVSEANIIGMAAGLAMEGQIVYVSTIATFLTRRCYEQVAVDLCMHNANVRLLATSGGYVNAPLGPTHQAIEDIAIFRALPNMTVLAPADAVEMRRLILATLDHPGPIYVRMGKGHDAVVTKDDGPFQIGKAVTIREGSDAVLLTTGVSLQVCVAAADLLKSKGIEAGILHLPTIKPLDAEGILAAVQRVPVAISVEEHTLMGGLGSAIAEVLCESDLLAERRFKRIGIPDVFADKYGDQIGLMKYYGISPENIAEQVLALRSTLRSRAIPVRIDRAA